MKLQAEKFLNISSCGGVLVFMKLFAERFHKIQTETSMSEISFLIKLQAGKFMESALLISGKSGISLQSANIISNV